ncbi:radical SAM protein [Desulfosporosinus nitroreducens]|uniref:Radical SAM protein n=1 Tax=Desulfosporosinus nitroreducens TaxID=2018668 RepID=A0ABT8QM65_9FIRM|nr:radical SAM protein [Desulfosporosinus nitroreducens]MCO1600607.1 radical SAM protein [Desulfosporosinus nitroreducens]MDO0822432.1 radical SAM protein [Desulfosporosinus nitroreducens]
MIEKTINEGWTEFDQSSNLPNLLKEAWNLRRKAFPDFIRFAVPGGRHYDGKNFCNSGQFLNVSITGMSCALLCDHCQGKMLKGMIPAPTPEILQELGTKLREKGVTGLLITGGCNHEGQVPLKPFLSVITYLKSLNFTIHVHTGLADKETAVGLKRAGVDKVFLDMMGDAATIRRVYHLDRNPSAYINALEILLAENLDVVPHVVLGLNYGKIMGEENLIQTLSDYPLETLVLVALRAVPGTPMGGASGPDPAEIVRITAQTRLLNPSLKLSFGCARPYTQKAWLERGLIAAGINTLAFPLDETIDFALACGLEPIMNEMCCGGL